VAFGPDVPLSDSQPDCGINSIVRFQPGSSCHETCSQGTFLHTAFAYLHSQRSDTAAVAAQPWRGPQGGGWPARPRQQPLSPGVPGSCWGSSEQLPQSAQHLLRDRQLPLHNGLQLQRWIEGCNTQQRRIALPLLIWTRKLQFKMPFQCSPSSADLQHDMWHALSR